MLTPTSMARTRPGGAPVPNAVSISNVAGRLLTTFARTADTPATTNRPTSVGAVGRARATPSPSPRSLTPAPTTPRANTNRQNRGDAPRTIAEAVTERRRTPGTA